MPAGSSSVPDLSIPGHPEILVTGDMMSLDKLPGVAEVAMQSGLYAGNRIRHELAGAGSRQAVPVSRPGLGRVHLPRPRGRLRRAGCTSAASPAGWSGCSSTSAS